jgi:hypothetical protein
MQEREDFDSQSQEQEEIQIIEGLKDKLDPQVDPGKTWGRP